MPPPDQPSSPAANPAARGLRRHVDMLARAIGERNIWNYHALERAASYIVEVLEAHGYRVSRQGYDVHRMRVSNLEAVQPASHDAAESIVVGAHYDSVTGCPGANDNATGVAAMLELARRFAGRSSLRAIRFVAFVNEEPPFFQTASMGSLVYANAARARGDRITAMLALETMGYYSDERGSQQYPGSMRLWFPDTGNFIGFVANLGSSRLLWQAKRAFKARTAFPLQSAALPAAVPGVGWSDHWAFWQAGYPAMMVTDTAPYRYPWYHTNEDTPDKISIDGLARVVDGLEHVVHVLSGAR